MQRRQFLAAAAATPLAGGLSVGAVQAASHEGAGVLPVARRFSVGGITVTAVSDGFLPIDASVLNGIEEAEFQEALTAAYIDGEVHPTGVNAYVIETGDRRVLVDAGTGTAMGPGLGQLGANLAATGIEPGSVDAIVATHLHPDHVGGAVNESGAVFPNAELIVSQADLDFWTDEAISSGAPQAVRPFFELAQAAVDLYSDRLSVVSGEADLGGGLTAVPMPGHTPGHIGVMVESDGKQLLIWGDVIHVGAVQFARPEVTIAFDTDQAQAAETRARVFDMAVTDRLMVAGMHVDFPGMGHLEQAGDGVRWIAAGFPYG
ncbi:MBL fold metallo-hydrolase [Aestuariibius sp. 2305UL40-4]|uniref:MBL fold metallo-hydrolase n=1 Tax=Aestuariibius violaceus TaxID=3234132 RepID=UPI00345EA43E